MDKGRHLKHDHCSSNRSNKRKAVVLLSNVILIVSLITGTTIAFLSTVDGSITNVFNPSKVSSQVNEQFFDGTTKSNVAIQNTGNTNAYIRAAIVVTWKDAENGNVYGSAPVEGTDYYIDLNLTDWFKGDDGFYYCKESVAAMGETAVLIRRCSAVEANTPEGYGLNVEILGSAIQSVPTTVVSEKWGVTVNPDGTLSR